MWPGSEWRKCWENSVHSLCEGKKQDVVSVDILETQYAGFLPSLAARTNRKILTEYQRKNTIGSIKRCIMSKQEGIPEYLEELIQWSRYTTKTKQNYVKNTTELKQSTIRNFLIYNLIKIWENMLSMRRKEIWNRSNLKSENIAWERKIWLLNWNYGVFQKQ